MDTRNGTPIRISDIGAVRDRQRRALGPRRARRRRRANDEDDVAEGIVVMRRGRKCGGSLRTRRENGGRNQRALPAPRRPVGDLLRPHRADGAHAAHRAPQHDRRHRPGAARADSLPRAWATTARPWSWRWRCRSPCWAPSCSWICAAFPANLISMGAIDFGIIVDSAVVVIENILRILEERKGQIHSLPVVIVEAIQEMGRPILFSKADPADGLHSALHPAARRGQNFPADGADADVCADRRHDLCPCRRAGAGQLCPQGKDRRTRILDRSLADAPLPAGAGLRLEISRARVFAAAVALLAIGGVIFYSSGQRVSAQARRRRSVGAHVRARNPFPRRNRPKSPKMCARRLATFPEVRYVVSQIGPARRRHGHQRLGRYQNTAWA